MCGKEIINELLQASQSLDQQFFIVDANLLNYTT
jgi:hypothetical protein